MEHTYTDQLLCEDSFHDLGPVEAVVAIDAVSGGARVFVFLNTASVHPRSALCIYNLQYFEESRRKDRYCAIELELRRVDGIAE